MNMVFVEVRGETVAVYHDDNCRVTQAFIGGVEITRWAGADAILDLQEALIRLRDERAIEAANADDLQRWCAMHELHTGSSAAEAR